ncbi:MAG: hypothetical protein IPN22_03420 [Bacteroidetes bacterium]|nr:hypothetical protein [Bacteroidota bacterium]
MKKEAENAELWYKYAESARMFNDYGSAATAYKTVLKLDKSNAFPLASFYAAEMLRAVCECKNEEALALYKKFRNKYRKQDYYTAKTQQQMESIAWANAHLQRTTPYKLNISVKTLILRNQSSMPCMYFRTEFSFHRSEILALKRRKVFGAHLQPTTKSEKIFLPQGASESMNIR